MKNIIREGNKFTALKIKSAYCEEKENDAYILTCVIKERGIDYYTYYRKQDYITKTYCTYKKLFLSNEAIKTINEAIDVFNEKLNKMSKENIDYLKIDDDSYLLMIRKNNNIKIY